MLEESPYNILDVFNRNTGFQILSLNLNGGDEMADSPINSNRLFKGGIQLAPAFFGIPQFHQQVFGARLANPLDCSGQFIRVDAFLKITQDGRVAHSLNRLYEHCR